MSNLTHGKLLLWGSGVMSAIVIDELVDGGGFLRIAFYLVLAAIGASLGNDMINRRIAKHGK